MSNLKIVTFNFRCVWNADCCDGINNGIFRIGSILNKIENEKPDVIGFQEIIEESLCVLKKTMPEYLFVGQLRNKDYKGEGLYTAIRKDTLDLIGLDMFWIGPDPYEPESRFESQSECPRVCITAALRHKESGVRFRVYNVHLDHIGELARVDGIKCVLDMAVSDREKGNFPMVLLGDFNAYPDSETIEYCNNFKEIPLTDTTKDIKATFHDFGRRKQDCKIDYIFVSDELKKSVKGADVWTDEDFGVYFSDHYPVVLDMEV